MLGRPRPLLDLPLKLQELLVDCLLDLVLALVLDGHVVDSPKDVVVLAIFLFFHGLHIIALLGPPRQRLVSAGNRRLLSFRDRGSQGVHQEAAHSVKGQVLTFGFAALEEFHLGCFGGAGPGFRQAIVGSRQLARGGVAVGAPPSSLAFPYSLAIRLLYHLAPATPHQLGNKLGSLPRRDKAVSAGSGLLDQRWRGLQVRAFPSVRLAHVGAGQQSQGSGRARADAAAAVADASEDSGLSART